MLAESKKIMISGTPEKTELNQKNMETNITHEDTVTRVMEALESIRPFLNKDGGDIELIDVKDNQVFVKLLGNCSGCSLNFSTLKLGVENTIKQHAPEIEKVINVE
jgi:Fe-S cluster biogenesis protein NfuA